MRNDHQHAVNSVPDDGAMECRLDPVLSLFGEKRLDVNERARNVQRSVAKLVAQHALARAYANGGAGPRTKVESEATIERTLRPLLHEYAAILRQLGAPPERAIADVKRLVMVVVSELRVGGEETTNLAVRCTIEGYYGL